MATTTVNEGTDRPSEACAVSGALSPGQDVGARPPIEPEDQLRSDALRLELAKGRDPLWWLWASRSFLMLSVLAAVAGLALAIMPGHTIDQISVMAIASALLSTALWLRRIALANGPDIGRAG